ncbi:MAG TPA: ribosome maturation factor RimM [Candidatus Binatia bacterium]|nr:ribosome maturation factor RimM [Candidatus Binatia bacterium]
MPPRLAPTGRSSSRSSKRNDATTAADGAIAVAEVVAAHALKGFLRVRVYQPPAPSLAAGRQLLLEQAGTRRPITIVSAGPHARGLVLVTIEGVTDRTAAEALVGARLLVPAGELAPLADDEFYWHEIEGFRVETVDGTPLGTVHETFSTGVNDVWVVRDGTREQLIPVIADVVRTVDRAARRIVIAPMPGLLA